MEFALAATIYLPMNFLLMNYVRWVKKYAFLFSVIYIYIHT